MGGLKIRGLPLGDSITFGFQSTDGTGYRLVLQDLIDNPPWVTNPDPSRKRQSGDGSIVDYIGSVDSGAMPDPENEGHSGAEIAEISTFVAPDLAENPNVVFLLAGTNDINNGDDDADAPTRLMAIVDQITSTLPDTVVLVGSIPLNGNADLEPAVDAFNQAVNQAVLVRFADGARVMTVSMYDIGPEDMADGLHPNDAGYALMASRWFGGFWQAAQWGWIDPATGDLVVQFPTPPSGQCSDLNDNSTAVRFAGVFSIPTCRYIISFLVDLNGDGREEYLWLDIDGATTAFLNLGSTAGGTDAGQVQWLPSGVIATGVGARRDQVRFADLNGDGRAEYLFVHDDGSVDAWLNLGGPDDGPEAAKVSWFPAGTIATGIGQDGAGVRFADLNGDGRAEYLWIDENGAMTAYLNLGAPSGGTGAANVQWLPQGVVATGPANGATRDNVILADINGDGKADYITVTHDGGVASLFINGGGPDDGPNAAKVVWFPQGVVATGVGTSGVGVQFADLDGDGRADYVDVDYLTSAVNAWLNGCQ
ncbi:SGNH hydrolase-type esterase domain-containing protein [Mycena latifolia]|nr:SGNH hydrolase-type esterase domain-containing protein [Mycena latifolia]